MKVEADSYWCLTKLMDNIQDRYTFSQVTEIKLRTIKKDGEAGRYKKTEIDKNKRGRDKRKSGRGGDRRKRD